MGARSEAIRKLGKEDDYIGLSALNKEREVAQNSYNTAINSLQNEYNNLLSSIANSRENNLRDFNKGRSTVRENAFMSTRSDLSDLASRGLSGGISQLSKLGNRMETGRQYSDLANTYYNTNNELDTAQKQGTDTYNINREVANNTLQSQLANIGTREAEARNAYRQAVATLAETIQARIDANKAAQDALDYQKEKDAFDKDAAIKSDLTEYAKTHSFTDTKKYAKSLYFGDKSDSYVDDYIGNLPITLYSKGTTKTSSSPRLSDAISLLFNGLFRR